MKGLQSFSASQGRRYRLSLLFITLSLLISPAFAGQLFTNGLSIIDAPTAGSPGHAGSNIPIAVDVSGNGKLPADAANPTSTSPSHFTLLEIYLVSAETGVNLTVTSGTSFLTSETGSVRHLDFQVPTCIPAGQYNLTFYETFLFNTAHYFTITPISIPIDNPAPSGKCTEGINPLLPQPQVSSPLAQSPFADGSTLVTITISDGGFDFPTVTQTVTDTAITSVVIVTFDTVTSTVTGQQGLATTVVTETFTTTAVMGQSDASKFIPVNLALTKSPALWQFAMPLVLLAYIFLE